MASSARIDEIKKKFDENPRRYFAPLANEFRKVGDLDQAILICEEFLPQQAGHMSGHIVYGQALFEAGRLPESRTVFETALGLDPENLIALRHLGDIARAQGELTDARRWYDRVLDADPRNEEIQGLLGSLDGADDAGIAPTMAPSAASSSAGEAPTVEMNMFAVPVPAPATLPPPLETIDLELDPAPPASAERRPIAVPAPDAAFDAISLEGLEVTEAAGRSAPAQLEPGHPRAEGLEPSEFEVPSQVPPRADGLEPGEFEAPSETPVKADGLEATAHHEASHASTTDGALLDLESSFELGAGSATTRESVTAPLPGLEGSAHHGSASADGLAFERAPDAPMGHDDPRLEPPAAMEAIAALAPDVPPPASDAGRASVAVAMMELPPSVIAAESALMDAAESGTYHDGGESGDSRVAPPPFVTETMAELYLSQGFREEALGVYRQLLSASPDDERLRGRLAALERVEGVAGNGRSGPTVREFFFRLATRRPGERASETAPPAVDDFAVPESAPATGNVASHHPTSPTDTPASVPEMAEAQQERSPSPLERRPTPALGSGAVPSPAERAATAQGDAPAAGGTIDALFGTRAPSTSEDSAASALAQAFGGASETPALSGRPARAATAELSLDSVFRDSPQRAKRSSQSFSFDQFFTESAATTEPAPASPTPAAGSAVQGEPAERSADDVQQFNTWLHGLKPL
jgi:tetratricopeptide (TPR) repeat protein